MERTTVRGRTTLLAVLVVGVALLVAWFAVVRILSLTQEAAVRDAASLRAADFVALLESGATPDDLRIGLEEDVLVQVVDDSGAVVAASPSLEARAPIAQLDPGGSVTIEDTPTEPDDSFLVVARAARHPTETFTILVGRNLDSVTEASAVVTLVLGSSIPLLLFIVGATTWKVVGRALEPVERMRARAEEISAGDLGLRIPGSGTDDELGRLGRTLNEMLERLERARLTQQRFVSDASHELRNPIAAIRQHAESALAHPETTDVPRLAEEVTREALRLQHLTEDLLFFARSAEASAPIRLDRLRMDEVVLEVVRRSVRSPDLRIDTSAVAPSWTMGDGHLLERLIDNLVSNATRHATSDVRISVRTEVDTVFVVVEDDGPGVPADAREIVFERFTRLDEARARNDGGAGLGLAIVRDIARLHGGDVTIADSELGGARFLVKLPLRTLDSASRQARPSNVSHT